MFTMTRDQAMEFLAAGARTGKVATASRDGKVHVAPLWFVVDGQDLVFVTTATSVKGRHLHANPLAALCVDDDRPPFGFVVLQGRAVLSEDVDELRHWATRIGGRYMGEARAEEFGRRNGVPGELLVRVRIAKVLAYASVAD